MRDRTPPLVDVLWRRFRREASPFLAYAEASVPEGWERLREMGLSGDDVRRLRPLVPLPGLVTWNVEDAVATGRIPEPDEMRRDTLHGVVQRAHAGPGAMLGMLATTASGLVAWRAEKRVYRLTPALAAGLRDCRWPGGYPTAQLALPTSGIALEIPAVPEAGIDAETVLCYYDLLTASEATGDLEIRITSMSDGPAGRIPLLEPLVVLHLSEPTLDGAVASALALVKRMASEVRAAGPIRQVVTDGIAHGALGANTPRLRIIINALLFILGDDDVVAEARLRVPLPAKQARGKADPAKAARLRDLAPPQVSTVGVRYAAAVQHQLRLLEAAEREDDTGAGDGDRSVRPHLRAAHAHLYWTGPGRQVARVHYLPPILVKGGPAAGEEADVPSVRIVR